MPAFLALAPPRTTPACSVESAALGLVGPVLRGEVGDTIQVMFKNKLRFPGVWGGDGGVGGGVLVCAWWVFGTLRVCPAA